MLMGISIPLWGLISGVTALLIVGIKLGSFSKNYLSRIDWDKEKNEIKKELEDIEGKISKYEIQQQDSMRRMHNRIDEVLSSVKSISENVAFFRGSIEKN